MCMMSKSNVKQASPLSFAFTPTVTREARHSPPSPLRKKVASRRKSRLRRKKTRRPQKNYSIVWKVYPWHRHVIHAQLTIRQHNKCAGAKYCAPTRWCIPSRQRSHPLHAPTATVAERYYPASYRRGFFSAEPTFFPRSGFFFGRRGM